MGLFDLFKKKPAEPPFEGSKDAAVVAHLKKHGSDLSKPHNIDFFFYVPDQVAADNLAQVLRQDGYEAVAGAAAKGNDFCVQATKAMPPAVETMEGLTVTFEELAKRFGGTYDGWGTGVVK